LWIRKRVRGGGGKIEIPAIPDESDVLDAGDVVEKKGNGVFKTELRASSELG